MCVLKRWVTKGRAKKGCTSTGVCNAKTQFVGTWLRQDTKLIIVIAKFLFSHCCKSNTSLKPPLYIFGPKRGRKWGRGLGKNDVEPPIFIITVCTLNEDAKKRKNMLNKKKVKKKRYNMKNKKLKKCSAT